VEEKKLSRREREKAAQRREILEAARGLFSEKGYRNVSVREIAEKAEFAIGTLYKFFQDKEELYRDLLLDQAAKFIAASVEAIEGPGDEIEKLRAYVRVKGEIFRTNATTIRLFFSEIQGSRQNVLVGFDSEIHALHDKLLARLAAVFERGIKRRRFRKIAAPLHLALALEGLTDGFDFQWIKNPGKRPPLEDPDSILAILFKGLVI
jgi:TetR/AcrR family transcriptional regulator